LLPLGPEHGDEMQNGKLNKERSVLPTAVMPPKPSWSSPALPWSKLLSF